MAAFYVRRRKANQQARSGGICDLLRMENSELSVSKQYVETIYSVFFFLVCLCFSDRASSYNSGK